MCGRYYIEADNDEMREIIMRAEKNLSESEAIKTAEVFPRDVVPAVTREAVLPMRWGCVRYDGKGHIINARSETAPDKPVFRKDYAERRCLIPASHYFEWERVGTKKVKHALREESGGVLYMAGIYHIHRDEPLPRFVILTREAAPEIAHIHDRMPVIVHTDMRNAWLTQGRAAGGAPQRIWNFRV